MRLGFLDEAGRSRQEPTIVVAGIIINGDRTYRRLVRRLQDIADQHLPEPDRKGFVFHAKDIFHGSGRYFRDREVWPRKRRWPILAALASLPKEFGIPVVFGYLAKAEYRATAKHQLAAHSTAQDHAHVTDVAEHVVAFAHAEIAIERQMHQFPRDEICLLIAEDTDRVKRAVKMAHAILRNPDEIANSEFARLDGLPLVKIEDVPHFAEKAESRPLQLADTCAFLILRRLARHTDSQQFFEAIAPQLTWAASDFGEQMGVEAFGTGSLY